MDLDNEEAWSKAYLHHERTTKARANYEDKVIFKHVQISLVASNDPLIDCGPLPDWLRGKRCIYVIGTSDDNLCVWRCLVIHKRHARGGTNQIPKRNCKAALDLAREYHDDNKWGLQNLLILRHCKTSKCEYYVVWTKEGRGKDAGSIWRLVYSKIQNKNDLLTINMGLLGGR